MKKILITGATGFIGTHLIPQLIKNHKIVGISKNKIKSSKNFISSSINITNENLKIKNIIAVIGSHDPNASIKIHEKNGFDMIGTIKKAGFKKNQWVDAIYMQKILDDKN